MKDVRACLRLALGKEHAAERQFRVLSRQHEALDSRWKLPDGRIVVLETDFRKEMIEGAEREICRRRVVIDGHTVSSSEGLGLPTDPVYSLTKAGIEIAEATGAKDGASPSEPNAGKAKMPRKQAPDTGRKLTRQAKIELVRAHLKEHDHPGTLKKLRSQLAKLVRLKVCESWLSENGFTDKSRSPRRAARRRGSRRGERESVSDDGPADLSHADSYTMPD